MRNLYRIFFVVLLTVSTVGCSKDEAGDGPADPEIHRTVLVYIAADNNLYSNAWGNLSDMARGMKDVKGNLVVYLDAWDDTPRLIKIGNDGSQQTLETYEKENSASPEVLRKAIARTKALCPAPSYGLIMWSHGNGWIPGTATGVRSSAQQQREGMSEYEASLWEKDPNALPTKWFGQDLPTGTFMDIRDLAEAVRADGEAFDFILFDACFMSSVEALYDLRHAAEYIVASPAEILADGFPYAAVLPSLFPKLPRLEEACRLFVDHYRHSDYPSATVALVRTSELEALAGSVRDLIALDPSFDVDADSVQHFENMQEHVYHDLADFVSRIAPGTAACRQFESQLARTVLFTDHTPYFYSAYGYGSHWVGIESCCGVSAYIPAPGRSLNADYARTAWAEAIGISVE